MPERRNQTAEKSQRNHYSKKTRRPNFVVSKQTQKNEYLKKYCSMNPIELGP